MCMCVCVCVCVPPSCLHTNIFAPLIRRPETCTHACAFPCICIRIGYLLVLVPCTKCVCVPAAGSECVDVHVSAPSILPGVALPVLVPGDMQAGCITDQVSGQ